MSSFLYCSCVMTNLLCSKADKRQPMLVSKLFDFRFFINQGPPLKYDAAACQSRDTEETFSYNFIHLKIFQIITKIMS